MSFFHVLPLVFFPVRPSRPFFAHLTMTMAMTLQLHLPFLFLRRAVGGSVVSYLSLTPHGGGVFTISLGIVLSFRGSFAPPPPSSNELKGCSLNSFALVRPPVHFLFGVVPRSFSVSLLLVSFGWIRSLPPSCFGLLRMDTMAINTSATLPILSSRHVLVCFPFP